MSAPDITRGTIGLSYAMPGTELAYGAPDAYPSVLKSLEAVVALPIILRAPYALSGSYCLWSSAATMRCPVLSLAILLPGERRASMDKTFKVTRCPIGCPVLTCRMLGSAYALAMRCPVLTSRMGLADEQE
eukprot:2203229-Rhodomonas_salina.4